LAISLLEKLLRSAKLVLLPPYFFSALPVKKTLTRLARKGLRSLGFAPVAKKAFGKML
jgi:hypothetical protein